MSDTKRTEKDLADLFDATVDVFTKIVKEGEINIVTDKESGEMIAVKKTISPAMAANVLRLLKDNNITASPAHKGLRKLADMTPFKMPDDDVDLSSGTYQ